MKTHALILGLAAWLTPTLALADMMSVSSPTASFRSGPSQKDKVLFSADLYYPVQVVEKKNGWTKVRDFEGETAWVTSQHLVAKPTIVIKADKANIREKANTDADVLFQVERGEVFKVVDRKGNWVSVIDANKDGGWIRADMTWGLDEPKDEVSGNEDAPKPECTCTKKGNEVAVKAEAKADKATEKADKAEAKAEKATEKADKAEAKADKATEKAEKAEAKADKAEKVATETASDDDDAPAKPEKADKAPKAEKAEKAEKADKARAEKATKAQPDKKKKK